MKNFENICKMTQAQVKTYMKKYLTSKKYDVVDEDGFLYAKGDVPVLLVAHMDTVHKEQCSKIIKIDGKLSSPQGIGGDDRCGIYIIMNLVKEFHCSVLLCEDEESGGVGARKFTKATYTGVNEANEPVELKYIDNLGVNYMVEFDRRGNNDAVFYSCDNKDWTNFVEDCTGYKFTYGSFSDISVLMPEAKIAAVNLSSGYYKAHSTDEYVVYDEMMDTVEAAKALIKTDCPEPFQYIAKKYEYSSTSTFDFGRYNTYNRSKNDYISESDMYDRDLFDMTDRYTDKRLYKIAKEDKRVEIEAIITNLDGKEEVLYEEGDTKAECWMNLFLENPDLCFNQITDYNWF